MSLSEPRSKTSSPTKSNMKFPLFKVHVDKKSALKHIAEVLDSGFINEGTQVTQFTEAMQQRLGTNQLLLVNSCTSAITLALHLAGVKRFEEVVTTSMTCVASNCPIVTAGADVVWADIDPETGCLDVESVRTALESNPIVKDDKVHVGTTATKAVIVVAWAGNPPDLLGLRAVCDQYGTKLILDAAHAFGAAYFTTQKPPAEPFPLVNAFAGIADFTCFSFQAIKHVTTGDGGMLVCRSEDDWRLAKQLKWFGIDRDAAKDAQGNWKGQHWDFDVVNAGFKFNMNNLTAAIGLSQLPHVDKILKGHKDNAALYADLFSKSKFLVPLKTVVGAESAHWVYTVLLNEEHKHIRDELLKRLNAEGIGAGLVHVPNDDYTCFAKFKRELPGVRSFFSRQLSLPVGWWLKPSHIKTIARRVNQLCKELTK